MKFTDRPWVPILKFLIFILLPDVIDNFPIHVSCVISPLDMSSRNQLRMYIGPLPGLPNHVTAWSVDFILQHQHFVQVGSSSCSILCNLADSPSGNSSWMQ